MNRGSAGRSVSQDGESTASMRPRFMNRGSERSVLPERSERDTASMRPRFMNRGSVSRAVVGRIEVGASMRPRFMNRGSLKRQVGL